MRIFFKLSWVVPTLLGDPLLFSGLELPLELAIVFANDSLCWIIKAITNIVGTLWYVFGSIDVITNQSFAIRPQGLHLLSVEPSVLNRAVIPFLILELEVIIKEVLA